MSARQRVQSTCVRTPLQFRRIGINPERLKMGNRPADTHRLGGDSALLWFSYFKKWSNDLRRATAQLEKTVEKMRFMWTSFLPSYPQAY